MPFCDVGDAQLHYLVEDYTDPWRQADTVLLHHPAFGTLRRWYAWVPILARHFRVVRFDVRGHGDSSPVPPDYEWSVDVLARDIAGVLDQVGVDAVHYVGASAGGVIGLRFAHSYPQRVKTLTLVASSALMAETKADYAAWVATIKAEGVEAFLRKDAPARFNPDTDPGFVDWFCRDGGRNAPHAAAGLAAHMASLDQRSLLPEIKCPVLVLGAGASEISPPSTQYYLRDHLPDADLVMLEGMKHNIQSSVPERCAEETLRFLARRGYVDL